jgi:hypothetical protein
LEELLQPVLPPVLHVLVTSVSSLSIAHAAESAVCFLIAQQLNMKQCLYNLGIIHYLGKYVVHILEPY